MQKIILTANNLLDNNIRNINKEQRLKLFYTESKYNSIILQKFVNSLILKGKKYLAYKFLYLFLFEIKIKFKKNPIYLLLTVLDYLKPLVKYRPLKMVTNHLQDKGNFIPLLLREKQLLLAIRNLIIFLKKKRHIKFKYQLFTEFIEILLNINTSVVNKKRNLYNEFSDNLVLSTFRWELKKKQFKKSLRKVLRPHIYRKQSSICKYYKNRAK